MPSNFNISLTSPIKFSGVRTYHFLCALLNPTMVRLQSPAPVRIEHHWRRLSLVSAAAD
jgi:hypothetical protein